jgi:hypothetical protein
MESEFVLQEVGSDARLCNGEREALEDGMDELSGSEQYAGTWKALWPPATRGRWKAEWHSLPSCWQP